MGICVGWPKVFPPSLPHLNIEYRVLKSGLSALLNGFYQTYQSKNLTVDLFFSFILKKEPKLNGGQASKINISCSLQSISTEIDNS
jgi:hypothetical protein